MDKNISIRCVRGASNGKHCTCEKINKKEKDRGMSKMATRDEMSKIITDMDIDTKAWIVVTAWDDFEKFPEDFTKTVIWYALRHAEEEGQCYNEPHGDSKWCTYWKVGNYIITYCTDDGDFSVTMLTEEMMDELIIEEA